MVWVKRGQATIARSWWMPTLLMLASVVGVQGRLGFVEPALAQMTPLPPPNYPNRYPVNGQPDGSGSPNGYNGYSSPNDRVYDSPNGAYLPPGTVQYRVYVNSDDPYLLEQIRTIEPSAFFQTVQGRRVIQTGTFLREANARSQAEYFAERGLRVQVVNSRYGQGPIEEQPTPSGYYAIVPAEQSVLPELRDRVLQIGIPRDEIRLSTRPIGPHLSVGPYRTSADAETAVRYLRDQAQLDARVYFAR